MKNKRQKCYRFVICLQFYKRHAFNEVIESFCTQMSTTLQCYENNSFELIAI